MPDEAQKVLPAHRIEYLVLRVVAGAVLGVSWPAARRYARLAGDIIRTFDSPQRKARMFRDIRRAFPEFAPSQVRGVIRGAYRSLMMSVADALQFRQAAARGRGRALVDLQGEELLADTDGRAGRVFVTAHLSCWEVMGEAAAFLGYPVLSIARPRDNPLLEEYVRRVRESSGQEVIPKQGAIRRALEALRAGRNLAFLIDQDARRSGIFVDFFGRPASTHTSVARLAISTGAPVFFCYCRWQEEERRFAIVVTDIIRPEADAAEDAEIRRITQRLTSDLEAVVRRRPAEWLWMHDRWKTFPGKYRPDGTRVKRGDPDWK